MQVQCPMCHGYGGEIEPILDDGSGPFYDCGFCKGSGKMEKGKLFYQCLGWLSASAKLNKKLKKIKIERNAKFFAATIIKNDGGNLCR